MTDHAANMALGRVSRPRGDGTFEFVSPAAGGAAAAGGGHMATLKESEAA